MPDQGSPGEESPLSWPHICFLELWSLLPLFELIRLSFCLKTSSASFSPYYSRGTFSKTPCLSFLGDLAIIRVLGFISTPSC